MTTSPEIVLPPLPRHEEVRPYITGTRGNPDLYSAHQVRLMLAADRASVADLGVQAVPGLVQMTDEDDGRVTLQFDCDDSAQAFQLGHDCTVDIDEWKKGQAVPDESVTCERCGEVSETHTANHWCDNQSFAASVASPAAPASPVVPVHRPHVGDMACKGTPDCLVPGVTDLAANARALIAALDQPFRYPGEIKAARDRLEAALTAPASPSVAQAEPSGMEQLRSDIRAINKFETDYERATSLVAEAEWISVDDRLPEERDKAYQILSIAKKRHGPGNYEGQGIKAVAQDWNVRSYASNYTHWMEIPAIVA